MLINYGIKFCLHAATKPYGRVSPQIQVAYIHDTVIIKCYSVSKVKWTSDNYQKTLHGSDDNTFILKKLKEKHKGYYVCHGTKDKHGKIFHARALVLVGGKTQKVNTF